MEKRPGAVEDMVGSGDQRRMPNGFWQRRRVFVTGATGFLGSHLVRKLVEMGSEVFALVRPGSNRLRIGDLSARIHIIEGDLMDMDGVRNAIELADPEFVYHLAAFGVDERYLTDAGYARIHDQCARFQTR